MKRAAVFFDRDNTLIVSDGYLSDAAQVKLVPGAAMAVSRARELGYAVVTFSNQSGVARGMFGEETVHAINARMDEILRNENPAAVIDRHEFCPFHPEAVVERYREESDLRKPKPGMILRAAEAMALDLSRSWVVGDAPRDIEAGKAAGCRTILFRDASLPPSPAASAESSARPDFVVATLAEALDVIEKHPAAPAQASQVPAPSPAVAPAVSTAKLEDLAEQILRELRHQREQPPSDFSVSKLLAGIVQVIVLAVLFYAYLTPNDNLPLLQLKLMVALTLQTLTIALLIMGHQR